MSDEGGQGGPWRYPLDLTCTITVERSGKGYTCRPERTFAAATPAWGLSQNDLAAARTLVHAHAARAEQRAAEREGGGLDSAPADEGIAEAFVNLLRHEVIPPVPGFRVVRLVPPPAVLGERPLDDGSSVVVGERVVVTWVSQVADAVHEAPLLLSHLDAVGHLEVAETHGVLLWTTPGGREVPVAWATKYLPRARDGWDWCLDLTQRALGLVADQPPDPWVSDFPARIGRSIAKLHLALASPSSVLPEPTAHADANVVRAWHAAARERVELAAEVGRQGRLEGVAEVLLPRLDSLRATIDEIATLADDLDVGAPAVLVQRVHGDLHVGQVLRWSSGLAVVDFHPNPVVEVGGLTVGQPLQPAARDLARLLRSLDHVARVVDRGTGFALTDQVDAWSRAARHQLLTAYRDELTAAHRADLLEERVLAPFEAEQLCREIVYAAESLPDWVYAPLGGLWQTIPAPTDADAAPARRGRRARDTLTMR